MNRKALKLDAKSLLNAHFKFFLLLFIPVFVLEFLGGYMTAPETDYSVTFDATSATPIWSGQQTFGTIISLLSSIIAIGIAFVCIDAMRQKLTYEKPLQKSMTVFDNVDYFLGTILIYIIQTIFVFLWMILLIIPGIIKSIAYSQSFYAYRDAVDHGEKISYLDAITRSRKLMDGHKWEYFVMALSFIGWGLLVVVTVGIAAIWVQPYMALSFANFYRELVDEDNAKTLAAADTINQTPSSDTNNQSGTNNESDHQSTND